MSMADRKRVIVVGHINHDRIWRLTEPLRAGGRIAWSSRETRLGGGGYFTARRLLELAHDVALLSNLMTDAHGREALTALQVAGFDTTLITQREGETDLADILLDPTGERTILSSERRLSRSFHLDQPIEADAFYVNAPKLTETILASLHQSPLALSQFPLREAEPRPADVMIGSKADLPGMALDNIWNRASTLAGPRLRHLVMTDGPATITVFDGSVEHSISLDRIVSVRDTIGAGDTFSGSLLHELLQGTDVVEAAKIAGDETTAWLAQREAETQAATEKSIS